MNPSETRTLPREIGPGIFWFGECISVDVEGRDFHAYNAAFLVAGSEASVLIETGSSQDLPFLQEQVAQVVASGIAPIRYIFPTHQETPHSGGSGLFMTRYPDALLCGDLSDYHHIYPSLEDRFHWMAPGEEVDLGGTAFRVVEPTIRDLNTTLWGFETENRALFVGDAVNPAHFHDEGHCACTLEEAPSLDYTTMARMVTQAALHWTGFSDTEIFADRFEAQVEELGVAYLCPTHGLPVTDVPAALPIIREGILIKADPSLDMLGSEESQPA